MLLHRIDCMIPVEYPLIVTARCPLHGGLYHFNLVPGELELEFFRQFVTSGLQS